MTTRAAQDEYMNAINREACIICPGRASLPWFDLERSLVKQFGGFNRIEAWGAWHDGSKIITESNYTYTIAMLDTPYNREGLVNIAKQFRLDADQDCVYVRMPDGTVTYVNE
jgi:hypothetical protein